MCIIACTPAGLKLDKATFDRCWNKNPDGFGMAYLWEGKIRVKKTMDKAHAWSMYNGVCGVSMDSWKILHFRIGTHGVKDITNCHPFIVHDDLVFAHNGIIRHVPDCPNKVVSDTQMFNSLILQHLPKDFYKWEHYRMLIEEYIGYSKLTFLDTDNNMYIYNESKGEWYDGVWFSNSGYKKVKTYVPVKCTPQAQKEKMIAEMTDAEFSEYCCTNNLADTQSAQTSYLERSRNKSKQLELQQCEYCMKMERFGKLFPDIGFICAHCLAELTEMGIDPQGKTLEQLVDAMFSSEQVLLDTDANAGTKIQTHDEKWLSWDEYYEIMNRERIGGMY